MATITASRLPPIGAQENSGSSVTSSHPFTCNTCQVAFRNGELQRGHMRSDWQYEGLSFLDRHLLTIFQVVTI